MHCRQTPTIICENQFMARIWIILTIVVLQLGSLPSGTCAAELKVAAAADLTFVFKEIGVQYEKESGNSLKISFGSSGDFFSQIKNGAPYDIFFSADVGYPKRLEAIGLTEQGTLYEYARGKLVIWVPSGSKIDLSQGMNVLRNPSIGKIAIANPEHAPYGAAAVAALRHAGIYDQIKNKLVMGENISQTAQFVQSDNADVGMLALSLALAPVMKDNGRYLEVPADDYPPIVQAAVILKASTDKQAASSFIDFLKRPSTTDLLARYGFSKPSALGDQ
jgi:molybdate transport system substrate-binding protein